MQLFAQKIRIYKFDIEGNSAYNTFSVANPAILTRRRRRKFLFYGRMPRLEEKHYAHQIDENKKT